jgi:hypothetical protein
MLQLPGGAIPTSSKDTRKFSTICIGRQELHDIEVSQYFEQLLLPGEEIELTLTCASSASLVFAIVGGILYFAGERSDFNELLIIGPVVFVVSIFYWFCSFINSGHEIYSVRVNDKLYRDHAVVQYETSAPPAADIQVEASAPPAINLSAEIQQEAPAPAAVGLPPSVQPEVSALPPGKSPGTGYGLSPGIEKHAVAKEGDRSKTSDLPAGFNSRILGVSKLICPQCATEALVVPETNIICGNCRVWMQVDNS